MPALITVKGDGSEQIWQYFRKRFRCAKSTRAMRDIAKRELGALTCVLAVFSGAARLRAQASFQNHSDRLDWQPTLIVEGARYVGSAACAPCHADIVNAQRSTAMAHALAAPGDSRVLQEHPRLTFKEGRYSYTIETNNGHVTYSLRDGTSTISLPVSWIFGSGVGEVGQTYLLSYKSSYYESRLSFYSAIQGLDFTLGHSRASPASIEQAIGRTVKPEELRACFGCHSSGAVSDGHLRVAELVPGITCEGCHGPGDEHVSVMRNGKFRQLHIFNPGRLGSGELVKFCGTCHRTRAHVEAIRVQGMPTVRFQPYRLTESRCFSPQDRRISCIACHDPHGEIKRQANFYDSKCLECHNRSGKSGSRRSAAVCPKAALQCAACHMPKYMLAGSHFRFTDHKIRVVRIGDNFD